MLVKVRLTRELDKIGGAVLIIENNNFFSQLNVFPLKLRNQKLKVLLLSRVTFFLEFVLISGLVLLQFLQLSAHRVGGCFSEIKEKPEQLAHDGPLDEGLVIVNFTV